MRELKLGRLTVVEQIAVERPPPGKPAQAGKPFSSEIVGYDQPYERELTVGPEWTPLDLGWLKACRMLRVECVRQRFMYNPTKEERDAAEVRFVELSTGDAEQPFAWVRPGESARFEPRCPLYVRCLSGQCQVLIFGAPA